MIIQNPIVNLKEKIEMAKNKVNSESKKQMNKNFKPYDISKLKRLFIKAKRKNKLDYFWEGPYEIVDYKKGNKTIKIKIDDKNYILSVRNVSFDFEERQYVGLSKL
ncbi:hypothetical protein DMUE_0589 [Dictyocoela muelleri]|nr:hypothetical protein DMUE_0589 [Dictyocoela muelleri]